MRTSWCEAQRKDPSLSGNIRRPEAPFKVSGDGVLERDRLLLGLPVVSNGVAGVNGVTWRKSCYNAVHNGILGAEVTFKLLERAVWWPDMERDVKKWVSRFLSCIKGRARPTKVEAKPVKCLAKAC